MASATTAIAGAVGEENNSPLLQDAVVWSAVAYGAISVIYLLATASAAVVTRATADAASNNNLYNNGLQLPRGKEGYFGYFDRRADYGSQPLEREGGGSKSRLVGKTAAETIEMAYWFVKFVGDYEKVRKEEIDRSGTVEEEGHWFKKNTKRVVLLARYLVKFVGSFEKLFNSK